MNTNRAVCTASVLLTLCLSACGGGGGAGDAATAHPTATADRRVLLSQYQPDSPAPRAPAQAQAAADYGFVTAPLALAGSPDAALVVPALTLAQRALLLAAAPSGAARSELLAQPGDSRGLAAGVAQRELQSLAGFSAWPEWLDASARGSADAPAPVRWSATTLAAWDGTVGVLPPGFGPSLRVVDRADRAWPWPAAAEPFVGVFEADTGERSQRRLLRLSGTGWAFATPAFSAQGLQLGGGVQLIQLRPAQGSLAGFARSSALGEALLAVNQRLRNGLALSAASMTLGDQPPALADVQALPGDARTGTPDTLPLTQLDGRGHYAALRRQAPSLAWDGNGLRLAGGQELVFVAPATGATGAAPGGAGITRVDSPWVSPAACPGPTALRPQILLAVDADWRLLWLARLPEQGSDPVPCL